VGRGAAPDALGRQAVGATVLRFSLSRGSMAEIGRAILELESTPP
jgi:hypothetical protein